MCRIGWELLTTSWTLRSERGDENECQEERREYFLHRSIPSRFILR